jgi:hypothetical protein
MVGATRCPLGAFRSALVRFRERPGLGGTWRPRSPRPVRQVSGGMV